MKTIRRKGDTLVEIMFAVGIFGMIAIGAIALMNHGLDVGQNTLEVTMARQEIDAQISALRFIHDAYTSEAKQSDSTYRGIWDTLTQNAYDSDDGAGGIRSEDADFYDRTIENDQTCDEIYGGNIPTKSFVVNPRKLDANVADADTLVYHDDESVAKIESAAVYPRLLYGGIDDEALSDVTIEDTGIKIHNESSLTSAEGIWVVAVASDSTANGSPDFYDFYVHTCWNRAGGKGSTTINSVIRLYNPSQIVLDNRMKVEGYSLIYDANGGSNAPDTDIFNDITYPNHTFTISSQIPVRTNHRFLGWARRPEGVTDCSSAHNALYHPDKANMEKTITVYQYRTTLCAVWEKNWVFQLEIHSDNSSSSESNVWTSDRTFETTHTFTLEETPSQPLIHTKSGYRLLGWSETPNGEVAYSWGDSVTLEHPIISKKLYAQWQKTSSTCTRMYRLQNADGSYPESFIEDYSSEVEYGDSCDYTKSVQDYITKSTSEIMGVNPRTVYLDLPRQTYLLTVDRNTTSIASILGGGTYRWGQAVQVIATPTAGHAFTGWSQTAGTAGTFANPSSSSTTFTMGKGNATVYANGRNDTFTCYKRFRLQNADGSYPDAYTDDVSERLRSGKTCTYEKTADHYVTQSTSQTMGLSDTTLSLSLPRSTYTCYKRYRLQKADGSYPDSYKDDGSVTLRWGLTCSYEKSVTDYKTKSTSEEMDAEDKTLSLSLPRKTYTLTINRNTTYIASVTGAGTYRWGQAVPITATAASGHDFTEWSQTDGTTGTFANTSNASTTFTIGKGNATIYADGKKGTFKCTKQYRLQNADGTYPDEYTADGSENVRSGNTCSYSKSVDYYTAKSTSGTVSSADITLSLSLPRTTYTCSKRYRLQNADGSYGDYVSDGSSAVRWGDTCSYSKTVTNYQTKSTSETMGKAAKTLSLDLPRNTYTCSKRYRLQNADGSYGDYVSDSSSSVRWGATCSYSKSVTDYQDKSTSAVMDTANKTLSLSLPRKTYKLTINRNTTYVSSVTGAGTYRWGQGISISATMTTNATFTGWTLKSGTAGTFANASKASTTFTMGKGNATIYADAKMYMQNFTKAQCSASCASKPCIVYDKRDEKQYKVQLFDGIDGPGCVMVSDMNYAAIAHRTSNGSYLYTWYNAQDVCPTNWKLLISGVRDGSAAGSYTFAGTAVYNLESKTLVTYATNGTCTPNDDRAYTRWCYKGASDCEWRCPLKANQDYTVRCTRRS